MKRIVLVGFLVLILAVLVFSKDLRRQEISKTFEVADTAGWADTFLGDWHRIDGARKLHFYVDLKTPRQGVEDTNFGADTFFINIQMSMNKNIVTKTFELDTLLTTGAGLTGADVLEPDSIHGDWMRSMLIWSDTTNIDSAIIDGRTFGKTFELYYSIQK